MGFESWGRYPKLTVDSVVTPHWPDEVVLNSKAPTTLAVGLGRSYADSCLNTDEVICTKNLNRFLSFDDQTGVLRAEAGLSLKDILNVSIPRGWFLPVSPGTKFVTLGGALANDVHGKNHHVAGTFGRHVRKFELLRSDGQRLVCSPTENAELYCATIGGIGLTGFITWVEVQLKAIKSPLIDQESIKFVGLDEFRAISNEGDARFEYTVAWLDCVSTGKNFCRGIYMRGNHSEIECKRKEKVGALEVTFPVMMPFSVLNPLTVNIFNNLYYHKQLRKKVVNHVHIDPFFYPLDAVLEWHRVYGKGGFLQFQCVVPDGAGEIEEVLKTVVGSGKGSFLAVLKKFGAVPSPGMISFPRPGITLALDFPFEGEDTLKLFKRLEEIVNAANGAMYPAKDATMSPESFRRYYPNWKEFLKHADPRFMSDFVRRVGLSNDA